MGYDIPIGLLFDGDNDDKPVDSDGPHFQTTPICKLLHKCSNGGWDFVLNQWLWPQRCCFGACQTSKLIRKKKYLVKYNH